jgi:formyltetrahydrofolate deformylase
MASSEYVLRFSCPNRPGIVFAVSRFLFDNGCNITDAQQFDDRLTGRFFGRFVFEPVAELGDVQAFAARFAAVAASLDMIDWKIRALAERYRVLLMASKFDHCLADLLYRWRTGQLAMDVAAIVSNHPRETYAHLDLGDVPFHHLPVTAATKAEQEARLWQLVGETGADFVVLARYMQILSDDLAGKLAGRCVNIHHSFLPGFKGAKPYHQAHARGVKLIGATAHFVTADLDEGPIIEQHVERVSHRDTPDDLIRKGADIERRVLSQAVKYLLEDRVLLNGTTTVVFPE